MKTEMKPGDRVKRRPINNFKYASDRTGTIINAVPFSKWNGREYIDYPKWYIKWDDMAATRQQHSSIQEKFLELI